jgi:energy-coupling factor transporter ATP-binding protein EcfA2
MNMPVRRAPQPMNPAAPSAAPAPRKTFTTSRGPCRKAFKIGIYGEPGAGKSTLASLCNGIVCADIEHSMDDLDVLRVEGIESWSDLRVWVQSQVSGICCIDSMSLAENWATEFVIKTKRANDGTVATTSLEDYKYKAGASFVNAEFRLLLSDIDAAFRRGVSWVMIAHDKVDWVRNPDDKDYRMHAPDLLETKDVSNRAEWVRFCDHIAFIGRDIAVVKGKASGGLGRTIYMDGAASRVCKMRELPEAFIVWPEGDKHLWDILGVK